ncbi:acyl-CoA/acyl-ACP dehydrogenase [Kiloniella laminariae]|uniref:Acyl-CoA/acyl-ACP dehydrogenase n=1 Tax=Kiloniella laminariae TaxID=454162 RepID=A0ABT4LIZ1_9PROT|nr:acyl-CoA dehydrogenase family protein [Kiloniella laminariae]MCZ4281069.1 acyl-CoA/acyl-ACP dehydrogenase [Kiloniella laminariae]
MDFRLPEEARVWAGKVREFVDHDLIPFEVEAELNGGDLRPEIRQRQRQKALDFNLSGMDAPKQYGGLELSVVEQVAIYEQLGRVTNALGWCFSEAHKWMFEACSDDQINRYVVPILKGERHECYAITEAESGSDVDGLDATARQEGDHYILNGEKWFVTSANLADFAIFQARLEGGIHAGAHVLFFVDLDTAGIEVIDTPLFSHTFEAHHPTYRFRDVKVPVANRIGDEGAGMDYTRAWFRRERLMIAARSCGAAERLLEEVRVFANNRLSNGQAIAQYQLVQAMLADSATELWAARLMTYEAAQAHDRGEDLKRLHARCSMVKLYASEMVGRVADRCVQIFGGRGYMRENPAERFYREVRVDRIWEGTSEIQRLIIGGIFNKRGLDGLIGSTNT